jgi:hypothetical protein
VQQEAACSEACLVRGEGALALASTGASSWASWTKEASSCAALSTIVRLVGAGQPT